MNLANRSVLASLLLFAFPVGLVAILAVDDLYAQGSAPQRPLTVSTDFEGGSARVLEIDQGSRTIRFTPGGDASHGWVCWWSLRIDNVAAGSRLKLELNASDQPTRNNGQLTSKALDAGWAMPAQASLSHDGKHWVHSEVGKRDGSRMIYEVVAQSQSLWVAWGPPFTPRDSQELIEFITKKLPNAKPMELARSRQGRPVQAVIITPTSDRDRSGGDPSSESSRGVWIGARQHAWETGSSWVANGIGRWLTSDDPSAKWLLDNAEIVLVPVMDVDNVATGNGGKEEDPRDHNRDWDDNPAYPEVRQAQQWLNQWSKQGRLDLFVDLHNPAPRDLRPFFFCGPPELLSDVGRDNRALFLSIASRRIDGPLPVEPQPRITGPSYHPLWKQISCQWVNSHGNGHTTAICLETAWNTPASTTEGYQTVGRQLGQTMAEFLQKAKRK